MNPLIKKIIIGTSLLSLVACAPQIKYLDRQSTKKENYETMKERIIEGLDGLTIKQIEGLDGQSTQKTLQDYKDNYWRK